MAMIKIGWNKIRWLCLVIGLWFPGAVFTPQAAGNTQALWYSMPQKPPTYAILGTVTSEDGEGLAGVSIELSDGQSTLTDDEGAFLFASLAPKSYVLTPVMAGYEFDPATQTIDILAGDQSVQFTARRLIGEETLSSSQGGAQGALSAPIDRSWGAVIRIFLWIVLFLAAVAGGSWLWQHVQKSKAGSAAPPQLSPGLDLRPDSLSPQQVQKLLREGMAAIRSQDVVSGTRKLKQVIQLAPDNAEAWLWLGWAAFQDNQARTAQRCFLQAQKLEHAQADKALQWLEAQKSGDARHD